MTGTSQQRAIKRYRKRQNERGVSRFEVIGRKEDRELIRTLARRLAEKNAEASRLRAEVSRSLASDSSKGAIFAALRRSPLVGADLDLSRSVALPRKVDL